jgi:Ca-activated chloride channel family protein
MRQFITTIAMLILLVSLTGVGMAGTTGVITGKITDAATGDPLVGVTVQIQGTSIGGLTDLNGNYTILRVDPGVYTLVITYVGYARVEVQQVTVNADLTTEISQKLTRSEIEKSVQIVKAKRDVISEFEVSGQLSKTAEQIKTQPVQNVDDVLQSVSGVKTNSNGDVYIRGGRAGEVACILDGQTINEPLAGLSQSPLPPFDMNFRDYGTNGWTRTTSDPLSTFAVDVDDASYNIVKQYLVDGNLPPADAVRVEEFINHFNYGYRPPTNGRFRVFTETVLSPFDNQSAFLKIGIKGCETTEAKRQPVRLTLVIDVSGSMGYDNRLELVKRGLNMLVDRMQADDQIGIVAFGSRARIVLEPTSGNRRRAILDAINTLYADGSTYAEAGLKLGYEMANDQYMAGCANRIILCSDGVANVGKTGPDAIMREVTRNSRTGITLSTFGFGMGNYNDVLMEQLAQKGNGRYAYVNNWDEAQRQFVENLVSNVQVLARDVKIQVSFDPNSVASYRLIGYENRAVADHKFRDNKTDGGEIGAGHEVTAVYELRLAKRVRTSQLASVTVRWKEPNQRTVQELTESASMNSRPDRFQSVRPELQLAVVASRFGEMLKGTSFSEETSYDDLHQLAQSIARRLPNEQTRELVDLISRARNLSEGYEYYHASDDDDDNDNYKR